LKSQPQPINISPELAARCDGPDQAAKMDQLFRAVLTVPRAAVLTDTAKRKQARSVKASKQT
jgi:hypothetical protein